MINALPDWVEARRPVRQGVVMNQMAQLIAAAPMMRPVTMTPMVTRSSSTEMESLFLGCSNNLLACSDVDRLGIERKTAVCVTDYDRGRNQHHSAGDATQDEADKSEPSTIRHDALLFLPRHKTRGAKRFQSGHPVSKPKNGLSSLQVDLKTLQPPRTDTLHYEAWI